MSAETPPDYIDIAELRWLCQVANAEPPRLSPAVNTGTSGDHFRQQQDAWMIHRWRDARAHALNQLALTAPALLDRIEALEVALEAIAEEQIFRCGHDQTDIDVGPAHTASAAQEIARAALRGDGEAKG